MQYSIAEIIELTGKSKATIYNYLNSGKMSYSINSNNEKVVDFIELQRVFPEITQRVVEREETTKKSDLEDVIRELERKNLELNHQVDILKNSLNLEREKFILLESKTNLLEEIRLDQSKNRIGYTEDRPKKTKKKWWFL